MTEDSPTPDWSDSAHALWLQYTARIEARLRSDDADAEEVIQDLRIHLEEEQRRRNLQLLSRQDMEAFLRRFGLPDIPVPSSTSTENPPPRRKRFARVLPTLKWIILVLIPTLALLDEAVFRDATLHFRPLFPHVLLFLMACVVPIQKALQLWKERKEIPPFRTPVDYGLNTFSTTVALWFSFLLLPMMLLGAVGAFLFFWTCIGLIGFLILSPAFCALHGIVSFKPASVSPPQHRRNRLGGWAGSLLAIALGVFAYSQVWQNEQALRLASEHTHPDHDLGIRLAQQRFTTKQLSHRLFGPGSYQNPLPFGGTESYLDREEREKLFHMITGLHPKEISIGDYGLLMTDFNNQSPWLNQNFRGWDPDQGGTEVGWPLSDLELVSSRIDGSVHAEGMLSYTEWTLVFKNHNGVRNLEARALIKLPSEAVVSRVTLWIDGEPREAAYGASSDTRRAYQSVVQRNRDPLLVTQAGANQVLAQCFPILPGETMKIRIGVSAPLYPRADGVTRIPLPRLADSNIGYPAPRPPTHVWIESDDPFQWNGETVAEQTVEGKRIHVLETEVPHESLGSSTALPTLTVSGTPPAAWAHSPRLPEGTLIQQTWVPAPTEPEPVVVLVDRSTHMAKHAETLASFLSSAPFHIRSVVLSGFPPMAVPPDSAIAELSADRFKGGPDPVPSLLLALREAARTEATRIFWIHANSPYLYETKDALLQYAERRPKMPQIISMPVQPGRHAIERLMLPPFRYSEAGIQGLPNVVKLPDLLGGDPRMRAWDPKRALVRNAPKDGVQTSDHLVRLWARDTIHKGLSLQSDDHQPERELGVRHQLVTPVTGAVVLETMAQYKANELEPVDPASVPSIPEPETWLLLIVLVAAITWLRFRSSACAH